MFRKNEEKYGVTTSYTPDMVGYTTPLNRRNTREYREREARATIIAEEIMSSPGARMRAEMENGDEEDKYVIWLYGQVSLAVDSLEMRSSRRRGR